MTKLDIASLAREVDLVCGAPDDLMCGNCDEYSAPMEKLARFANAVLEEAALAVQMAHLVEEGRQPVFQAQLHRATLAAAILAMKA